MGENAGEDLLLEKEEYYEEMPGSPETEKKNPWNSYLQAIWRLIENWKEAYLQVLYAFSKGQRIVENPFSCSRLCGELSTRIKKF